MFKNFNYKLPLNYIVLYIFLKLFIVICTYYINSKLLGNDNFFYGDIDEYTHCNSRSYNSFFTIFNCVFNIQSISNVYIIIFSYALSSMRDIILIFLSKTIFSKTNLLIFIIILSTHPYLAIYHPRFVTNLFASFGFLLAFIIIQNNLKLSIYFLAVFIFLTGFRNGLMPFFIMFIILQLVRDFQKIKYKIILLYIVSILFIYLVTRIPQKDYAIAFITDHENVFSWLNIIKYFSLDVNIFSYLITFPLVLISHLMLLLGFREAVFTIGFYEVFDHNIISYFQLSIFIILMLFHAIGLFYFYNCYKKDIRVWSFLAYFFPSIIFIAHMRYFLPMIPLVIIGFVLFLQDRKSSVSYKNNNRKI